MPFAAADQATCFLAIEACTPGSERTKDSASTIQGRTTRSATTTAMIALFTWEKKPLLSSLAAGLFATALLGEPLLGEPFSSAFAAFFGAGDCTRLEATIFPGGLPEEGIWTERGAV